jgi:hypothetical protein
MSRHSISIFIACVLGFALMASNAFSALSADDEKAVSDFQARVTRYLELKKKEVGPAPRSTNSADKVAETQETLASRTKAMRPSATQGEIFAPEVTAYFRKRISAVLAGAEGPKIRASLRHAEPVHGLALRVNEEYPEGVPLQSAPPTLLSVLPILPDSLEYRIVGRSLVLRDVAPNLVVDFIPNALPAIGE